ncbi:MAG: glycosyltransferase family 4 protein, partial [Exilispira sp.]|nr:glycosyltransferase family 4 protein [Exilispira sp.]
YMSKLKFLKLNQILSFIDKYFFWPDGSIFWANKAYKVAKEIILTEDIKLVYTTGGPFSTHLIGLKLKKEFPQIKWVAEFRDEWTSNPIHKTRFLRLYYEKHLERKFINNSDRIVVISETMKEFFINYHKLDEDKITVIYNGYDEEDFSSYRLTKNDTNKLKILYFGSLYSKLTPQPLFKAIYKMKKTNHDLQNLLELTFIGYNGHLLKKYIKKYKLNDFVNLKKRIEHNKLFAEIEDNDILLLIIGAYKGAQRIITSKIFEYMRMQKPILALGPEDGEVAKILKETGSGIIVHPGNIKKLIDTLNYLIERKNTGLLESSFKMDLTKVKKYERKELTGQLAHIFDDIIPLL